jgi:translation initiation factor IF-2
MADVTVSQLAEVVGTPVERLLNQMKEAGLSHSSASDSVSEADKQTLLTFLKKSHGESADAPKKITLKRKTLSTLKTGSGASRKTVNVEVRKKRTYVKREIIEEQVEQPTEEVVEQPEVIEPVVEVAEVAEVVEAEVAPVVEETPVVAEEPVEEVVAEEPAVEAEEPAAAEEEAPVEESRDSLDPEVLRQAAALRRKKKEEEERLAREEAQRLRDEEEARKQKLADIESKTQAKDSEKSKPEHVVKHRKPDEDGDDDKPRKKVKSVKDKKTRGKDRTHNLLHGDFYVEESDDEGGRGGRRRARHKNKHGFSKPTEKIVHEVQVPEAISVADLAQKMSIKAAVLVKELFKMGTMATVNQVIDQDTAVLLVEELGHTAVLVDANAIETALESEMVSAHEGGTMEPRAPVVTVMGHVDHGKTSLLDYIRKAKVASGEAGGITQHIGAYHVETGHGMITFLDTPGHAAFTAMRARGATSTDIVILVVAADDGVMPQTEEAIQHAKAAGVPLVVAVNKIDKESADPDRVKNELAAKDVIPEDWGGDTQFIHVSAHTGQGIDELLDAVLLQAEMLELQAPKDIAAQGVVIESRLDKGRGSVASVLIQRGTLNKGDIVIAGTQYGRIRAMLDENGKAIKEAGPSIPVEILGLDSSPNAGDLFAVVDSEKRAREIALHRQEKLREEKLSRQQAAKLENMFANMGAEEKKTLNVVLKADVRGSLEAIVAALSDIGNDEVQVNVVSSGVGGIAETDINLALTTGSVVFGFNVRADAGAKKVVEDENVDMRYYSVIYNLLDDVRDALTGMLSPELREEIVGIAEVREVFKSPKFGQVAGCLVVEGTIFRSKPIRVLRDDVVIFEGELESLRRFKDDANEVRSGLECGIGVRNYDVKVGDKIEVFDTKSVARSL